MGVWTKAVCLAWACTVWMSAAVADDRQERVIIVQGTGVVSAVPDIARLQIGVVITDQNARTAMSEAARAANRTMGELSDAGVEERDIRTSTLSLQPLYDNNRLTGEISQPRIVAFEARTGVTVILRDQIDIGSLVDDLVRAGSTEITGITFELDEPEPLLDQARDAAVRDARRKAELMVNAAGETLGPLLEIREAGIDPGPQSFARAEAMMISDVPIARGETELSVQVVLVFALAD